MTHVHQVVETGRHEGGRSVKVSLSRYDDPRLRSLPQETKFLYIRLLTGPETLSIPGVVVTNRTALALALDWTVEEIEKRVEALRNAGLLEVDWEAGVLFLGDPLNEEFNLPQSISTVKRWRNELLDAPNCALMEKVRGRLAEILAAKRKPAWLAVLTG